MKLARISNDTIAELFLASREDLAESLHPSIVADLVEVPNTAAVGAIRLGGSWHPEADVGRDGNGDLYLLTADDRTALAKAALIAHAANKRWAIETGGITVGGVPIATDDRSKLMIMGARVKADNDPVFTTPWVAADGSVSSIDAATIIAISDVVLAHVAACFAAYEAVKIGIDAGTVTTIAEIDAAYWP